MKEAKLHKYESITLDQSNREVRKENNIRVVRVILFLVLLTCVLLFMRSMVENQGFVSKILSGLNIPLIITTLPLLISIVGSSIAHFLLNLLYREQSNHVKLVKMDNSAYLAELKRKAKRNSLVAISQWSLAGLTKILTTAVPRSVEPLAGPGFSASPDSLRVKIFENCCRSTITAPRSQPKKIRLLRF